MITETARLPWEVGFERRVDPETPRLRIDMNATLCPEGFSSILGRDGKLCEAVVTADGTLQYIKVNKNMYSQGRNTSLRDLVNSVYMSADIVASGFFDAVEPVVVKRKFKPPTVYLVGLHKKS